MRLEGIIQKEGIVLGGDGKEYHFEMRGTDEGGFSDVLMNAKFVGGKGFMQRQSIKSYIGMRVVFDCNTRVPFGYNYTIINSKKGGKNEK